MHGVIRCENRYFCSWHLIAFFFLWVSFKYFGDENYVKETLCIDDSVDDFLCVLDFYPNPLVK